MLRLVMAECTGRGFTVRHLSTQRDASLEPGSVAVRLEVQGSGDVSALAAALSDVPGVLRVNAEDANVSPV